MNHTIKCLILFSLFRYGAVDYHPQKAFPFVFFKTCKLNRAAELLKEGKYNISEVADITGFSTLPHFSASFKKQFGMPPSGFSE